jgi:hypothetical protein
MFLGSLSCMQETLGQGIREVYRVGLLGTRLERGCLKNDQGSRDDDESDMIRYDMI